MAHAGLATREVVDHVRAHSRPAQTRTVNDRLVEFAGGGDAVVDHVQNFTPQGFLEAVGQVAGYFVADVQGVHADVGVEHTRRFDGLRRCFLAANQLAQGQQIDRVERMPHHQPLRRHHVALQIGRHDAGGTGSDDHVGGRRAADVGKYALL